VEKFMQPSMNLEGDRTMSWFFDQWVRGTGIPQYNAEFKVQQQGDQYVVKGVLSQTGVPPRFLASVPLYVQGPSGKRELLGSVVTSGEKSSFRFVTRFAPKRILIDPNMTLLCLPD